MQLSHYNIKEASDNTPALSKVIGRYIRTFIHRYKRAAPERQPRSRIADPITRSSVRFSS